MWTRSVGIFLHLAKSFNIVNHIHPYKTQFSATDVKVSLFAEDACLSF